MPVAYFDDSGVNHPPASILAGWMAPAERWAIFSHEWDEALRMRPRLEYFKFSEAVSLSGQFTGWSNETRHQRIRLLISIVEKCRPLGISFIMPHVEYELIKQRKWYKELDLPQTVYPILFYGIITYLAKIYSSMGGEDKKDKIDFVFDTQPDQMEKVMLGYQSLLKMLSPEERCIVGDFPIFRDDKTTLPLQAADLKAGLLHRGAEASLAGEDPGIPPWGELDSKIMEFPFFMSARSLDRVFKRRWFRRSRAREALLGFLKSGDH